MVDGFPESLERLCSDDIEAVEKEVINYGKTTGNNIRTELRNLWESLYEKAKSVRRMGESSMLSEEKILFTFLCQLSFEGWNFAEGIPCQSAEVAGNFLRSMWSYEAVAATSRQRGLDEQRSGEFTGPLRVLSSLLALHAQKAWDNSVAKNAAAVHPLAIGITNRVGKLRAFGNAIVPQVAAEFIRAFMEIRDGTTSKD
jgi:hypothetical protein